MTILWFWTFLAAAPFGMAAYLQAAEPGWKLGLGALALAALGFGYLYLGLPEEVASEGTIVSGRSDELRFRVAGWVTISSAICLAGVVVGRMLRGQTSPARLGLWAFLVAFIGMNVIILSGAVS